MDPVQILNISFKNRSYFSAKFENYIFKNKNFLYLCIIKIVNSHKRTK